MKTNKKKVMGRKMLTPTERKAGVRYEMSAAWQKRKANIKNRIAYKQAVPKEQRMKNKAANLAKNKAASKARKLAKASKK